MTFTSYSEIGHVLSVARREHQFTIPEIAKALYIRKRYIEALEQGNFEALPGRMYMKGYLLRYALYLSLDVDEIARRFDEIQVQSAKSTYFRPHHFSQEQQVSREIRFFSAMAFLMVCVSWSLFIRPESHAPSVVDLFPVTATAEEIQSVKHLTGRCFTERTASYPPCYWASLQKFRQKY